MNVEKNKVVTVHYTLTENTETGEQIESTFGQEPLSFIFGIGSMIPEFEKNLQGLKVGDTFSFGVKAKDGYGEFDENAIVDIPKNIFMVDGTISDVLQVGNIVPMRDQEGHRLDGVVLEIEEENVKMDFNHPMAGVDLWFTGEVKVVRDATQEEIAHGHAHGEGGHHH